MRFVGLLVWYVAVADLLICAVCTCLLYVGFGLLRCLGCHMVWLFCLIFVGGFNTFVLRYFSLCLVRFCSWVGLLIAFCWLGCWV